MSAIPAAYPVRAFIDNTQTTKAALARVRACVEDLAGGLMYTGFAAGLRERHAARTGFFRVPDAKDETSHELDASWDKTGREKGDGYDRAMFADLTRVGLSTARAMLLTRGIAGETVDLNGLMYSGPMA